MQNTITQQRHAKLIGMRQLTPFLKAMLLSALLFGCAPALEVKPIDPSADPSAELKQTKEALESARQNNVHLFSPGWYAKASDSYAEAENTLRRKGMLSTVLESTARAKAELQRAQKYAKISSSELQGVYQARKGATAAGAPELYHSEFERVEQRFMGLAKEIENDNISSARRSATSVEAAYQKLEQRAVTEHTLGGARKQIRKAINDGARRYVPKTLKQAQANLENTDRFITKNPRARAEIQQKGEELLRSTEHLNVLLQQAKTWSKMTEESKLRWVEDKVLAIENLASSGAAGKRAQSLDGHFSDLEKNVEALQASQKFLNDEVSRLQLQSQQFTAEVKELSEEKRKRQAEREFAAKFERVRKLFNRDEADVYRQGDELLIRIKGLNFPVGKSYIPSKHFPLLTKVQNSLKISGTNKVVVEGHTDLTGTRAMNEQLSQARADAVMAYLVNNNAIGKNNISAIGYGPDKPIAPNNTRSGRKLNRRIDVVLTVQ